MLVIQLKAESSAGDLYLQEQPGWGPTFGPIETAKKFNYTIDASRYCSQYLSSFDTRIVDMQTVNVLCSKCNQLINDNGNCCCP